eukprot:911568-Rhodomonas_salina.1
MLGHFTSCTPETTIVSSQSIAYYAMSVRINNDAIRTLQGKKSLGVNTAVLHGDPSATARLHGRQMQCFTVGGVAYTLVHWCALHALRTHCCLRCQFLSPGLLGRPWSGGLMDLHINCASVLTLVLGSELP